MLLSFKNVTMVNGKTGKDVAEVVSQSQGHPVGDYHRQFVLV